MSAAVLPIIKVLAPHLAQIASSAIPAFTRKPEAVKTDPVVAGQIQELQAAVTANSEAVRILADKIHQTIKGFEEAATHAKSQVAIYKALVFVSLTFAIAAAAASAVLWSR